MPAPVVVHYNQKIEHTLQLNGEGCRLVLAALEGRLKPDEVALAGDLAEEIRQKKTSVEDNQIRNRRTS